ncbi:hypothetical protein JHK87_025034 [Glycine soja]|nr:hypothetical protein JHK87_025034 [Glycine soja]
MYALWERQIQCIQPLISSNKAGWYSLDTVIVVESLALTLQASGNLKNSKELLERRLLLLKSLSLCNLVRNKRED